MDDEKGMVSLCRKYSRSYLVIGIPVFLGITSLSSEVLQVLGNARFVISPLVFGSIAAGLFADQLTANAHYLIYLHNEPEFLRNITIVSGLAKLTTSVILVPFVGVAGAAFATLASYALLDVLVFRRVVSYGFSFVELFDLKAIGKIVLSAISMVLAIGLCKSRYQTANLITLICLICIGVLIYAFTLWAINHFSLQRVLVLTGIKRVPEQG